MKLKKTTIICAVIAIMSMAASNVFAVDPVDITVGTVDGVSTAKVSITVTDPTGIAGAAFTLSYDTDILEITDVGSTFFDTFANQFAGTDADTSVPVGGTTYYQPLLTNPVSGTGMRIAAARSEAAEASDSSTLFTLTVALKESGEKDIKYTIGISQTTLTNTAAGYSASGETIPYLIGADASVTDLTSESAFPIISVTNANPGAVTFVQGLLGDVNGSVSITPADASAAFQLYLTKEWADMTSLEQFTADFNKSGSVTPADASAIFQEYLNQ